MVGATLAGSTISDNFTLLVGQTTLIATPEGIAMVTGQPYPSGDKAILLVRWLDEQQQSGESFIGNAIITLAPDGERSLSSEFSMDWDNIRYRVPQKTNLGQTLYWTIQIPAQQAETELVMACLSVAGLGTLGLLMLLLMRSLYASAAQPQTMPGQTLNQIFVQQSNEGIIIVEEKRSLTLHSGTSSA